MIKKIIKKYKKLKRKRKSGSIWKIMIVLYATYLCIIGFLYSRFLKELLNDTSSDSTETSKKNNEKYEEMNFD